MDVKLTIMINIFFVALKNSGVGGWVFPFLFNQISGSVDDAYAGLILQKVTKIMRGSQIKLRAKFSMKYFPVCLSSDHETR